VLNSDEALDAVVAALVAETEPRQPYFTATSCAHQSRNELHPHPDAALARGKGVIVVSQLSVNRWQRYAALSRSPRRQLVTRLPQRPIDLLPSSIRLP
jgi:hypothetical protein